MEADPLNRPLVHLTGSDRGKRDASWRLEVAGDGAEGGAESGADQGKRADSCDRNQRCDQAVLDRRNTAFVLEQQGYELNFDLLWINHFVQHRG